VKTLDQIRSASFWRRYWSLLAALILPVLVFFLFDSESTRALVSVICIVLLAHAWRMQIRGSHSIWQSMLWTSIVLLPTLGAIWLGLNVIRGETYEYAADYQRHLGDFRQNLYWYVVETQDWIVWIARIAIVLGLLFAVVNFFTRKEAKVAQGDLA
jgi:peptidoglycan/LPS O-acetylase OafA/YrhL